MKTKLIILFFPFYVVSIGQDVSESLAREVASRYYQKVQYDFPNDTNILKLKENIKINNDRTIEKISPNGKSNMWLVPIDDGWALVSGSQKVSPILAHFQTTKKPVYDSLTPAEQFLWDWYEDAVFVAETRSDDCCIHEKWEALLQTDRATNATNTVSPLLGSLRWGQTGGGTSCDKRYNKFCPPVTNAPNQCNRAAVGCVAVAIAQIMWYWKWPYAAYIQTTVGGSYYDMHFYNWEKMPIYISDYTPMDEVNEIAGFLRDCGYRLDMDYGISSSASDENARQTLKAFAYDDNTMVLRHKYNTSGWRDKLHTDLDAGRPVYYAGARNIIGTKGHAFVVDGYNSADLYHINIGWNNSSLNKYYNIDEIDVNDTIHYKYWQSAIFGIQPSPYCYSQTISTIGGYTKFDIVRGGNITLNGVLMENVEYGQVFSSSQVKLTNGVSIKEGCNVHIAIKNVPCTTSSSTTANFMPSRLTHQEQHNATENDSEWSIYPNPTSDKLSISIGKRLEQVAIYDLSGRCLIQTSGSDELDVSALSAGVYMLQAQTTDGRILQEKFIHL